MTNHDLIREAVRLDAEVRTKIERLKELKNRIAARATYAEGSKTGRLIGHGYAARVQARESVIWDQKGLANLKKPMGKAFDALFQAEYRPKSRKAVEIFLAEGPADQAKRLRKNMTVKPGQPSVSFERLEE